MMRENAKSRDAFQDSNLRRAGVEFKTRDVFQGSKINETRDVFQEQ
jgi:hypothetical protein